MSKNAQKIAVPLISVLLGFLLGAIIMVIFGYDPIWGGGMKVYSKLPLVVLKILEKYSVQWGH